MNSPLGGWRPAGVMAAPETPPREMLAVSAKETAYAGVTFRSVLEADWAFTLDHYGIEWEYEPGMVTLSSGAAYLPDFRLPRLATWIEVKGPNVPGLGKPIQYAEDTKNNDVIVLIGFEPARHSISRHNWQRYIQWRDAAGYDTRLARCQKCSEWQWLRPQISVACRVCGERYNGLLVTSGEMQFMAAPKGPSFTDWLASLGSR